MPKSAKDRAALVWMLELLRKNALLNGGGVPITYCRPGRGLGYRPSWFHPLGLGPTKRYVARIEHIPGLTSGNIRRKPACPPPAKPRKPGGTTPRVRL